MLTNKEISEITKKIAKNINPEKIYLFGSYANGKPSEDSDLDIAVILDNEKTNLDNIRNIRYLLKDVNNPMDIIVYKGTEFYNKIENRYTFETNILNEGILLYG